MKHVLILLCLSLLLTGCGTEYIVKREVVPELPPDNLIVQCLPPLLPVNDYGDAVEYVGPVLDALAECDGRMTGLREWRASRLRDPVFEDP